MARGGPQKYGADTGAGKKNNNGANLGFEAKLWAAADKLRGNMEPSDYKHVALGLIFLKYISDAFQAKREALLAEELAEPEDPEPTLRTLKSTSPKTSSGCPRKPVGPTFRPTPSSPQ